MMMIRNVKVTAGGESMAEHGLHISTKGVLKKLGKNIWQD